MKLNKYVGFSHAKPYLQKNAKGITRDTTFLENGNSIFTHSEIEIKISVVKATRGWGLGIRDWVKNRKIYWLGAFTHQI
ncbi:hypothetical protein [Nostoc sp. PA-18-2419]|uniref:hypothetical protein n=1 Tax=Nostoc sp. PA-18-2419 TaxID=2575443 RepID=UPI001109D4DA|nr:hypothetical protein [Nostoc sp. PA-18-2419]